MTAGTAALSGAAVAFRFCFQAQARRTGLTRRRRPNRQPSTMASGPVHPHPLRFTLAAVPTPGGAHAWLRNGDAIALMSASARSYRFPNDLLQLAERHGSPPFFVAGTVTCCMVAPVSATIAARWVSTPMTMSAWSASVLTLVSLRCSGTWFPNRGGGDGKTVMSHDDGRRRTGS